MSAQYAVCAACKSELRRRKFSKAQLSKGAQAQRCANCVREDRKICTAPTPTETRSIETLPPELLTMIAQHAGGKASAALASTTACMREPLAESLKELKEAARTLLTQKPFSSITDRDQRQDTLLAAVRKLKDCGYSTREIKKLGVRNHVMSAAGFIFPTDRNHGYPAMCPECWSTNLGHYLDDESIMGMGREWSVYCRERDCRWSIHGV